MPKGRGSNSRSKRSGRRKDREPAAAGPGGSRSPAVGFTLAEQRRREAAAEAGGFTREERRRSKQRQEEAARLAARRVAKAANEGSK
jgi:hypothetical protein